MGQKIVQVDAFTDKPFSGNPAAVCVMESAASERWMQRVAHEMNLSETAFLYPIEGSYSLRWFTPAVEVDLCGHATLASAHVLWEEGYVEAGVGIRFETKSGALRAERRGSWIELDFPARHVEATPHPPGLAEALGVEPVFIGKSIFDYLVEVATEEEVRNAEPDFRLLKMHKVRGVMVTSKADGPDYHFVSRFFAPGAGVDEDPVTGSAHCSLGPHWRDRIEEEEMVGYQASVRGGVVRVRIEGSRVILSGQAVTVLRGELTEDVHAED